MYHCRYDLSKRILVIKHTLGVKFSVLECILTHPHFELQVNRNDRDRMQEGCSKPTRDTSFSNNVTPQPKRWQCIN